MHWRWRLALSGKVGHDCAAMAKQSKTVDLRGFKVEEIAALAAAGMLRLPASPHGGDAAFNRLHSAALNASEVVSKVPRDSLQAFIDAIRPFVPEITSSAPALSNAVAKLDARLARRRGRPAGSDLGRWKQRAADVRRVKRELRRQLGYVPTDDAAAAALGVPPGTVGTWRQRHPDLFDAPESD